jgi:hypothetical protein
MVGEPEITPVRAAHRFDEGALASFLDARLGGRVPLRVAQFEGGQSNPTFLIERGAERLVLRKKPPGRLLPSAHQVDREYRVMSALRKTGVPVPETIALCEDDAVLGTAFFVMRHVPGRVIADPRLPGFTPAERAALYDDTARVLAALHARRRGSGRSLGLRPAGQLLRAPDLALEPPVRRLEDRGDRLDGGADGVAAGERPELRRDRDRPRRLPDRELHPAPDASRRSPRCSTGSSPRSAIRSPISPTSARTTAARRRRAARSSAWILQRWESQTKSDSWRATASWRGAPASTTGRSTWCS